MDFNPRSPCGERLTMQAEDFLRLYISIHAPRAGSDGNKPHCRTLGTISIHAPRAGSDQRRAIIIPRAGRFQSTLPVRGATFRPSVVIALFSAFQSTLPVRGATAPCSPLGTPNLFQSTLPVRGATLFILRRLPPPDNFNPRSPCGERRPVYPDVSHCIVISIHAPRAGSDSPVAPFSPCGMPFQSTLPVRGATLSAFF